MARLASWERELVQWQLQLSVSWQNNVGLTGVAMSLICLKEIRFFGTVYVRQHKAAHSATLTALRIHGTDRHN